MSRITRSISAEIRKVTATKMWWIMAMVLAIYAALMAGMFAALFGAMTSELGEGMFDEGSMPALVYSTTSTLGYVVPLLFGSIMATTELRHRTLGLAFIAEPKRATVLIAKLASLVMFGIIIGAIGLVGAVATGASILSAFSVSTGLSDTATWLLLLRIVFALALWAVIGFGVGLLVRNQAIAIVIALVFTQFLEPTLRVAAMFWEWSANIGKFLPGAASDAFVGASVLNDLGSLDPTAPENSATLGIWGGLGVLALYGVLVVGFGWLARWRKDIH